MRTKSVTLALAAAAALTLGAAGSALAFHSGGVAECEGCHTMHTPLGTTALLAGADKSSTCLNCHQGAEDTGPSSYHISTRDGVLASAPPQQRTPGGDFGWVKKTFGYSYTSGGVTTNYSETGGGHNIVASGYSYLQDAHNTAAPGGTYQAANLACTSCHDPHSGLRRLDDSGTLVRAALGTVVPPIVGSGSYHTSANPAGGSSPGDQGTAVGVYRLLGGQNYGVFGNRNPPAAVAPATYNRTEASTQTRVAYGKGMAEWCAACHTNMHTTSGNYVHPVSQNLGSSVANNYNAYRKSGDLSGTAATSYLSLVPYEMYPSAASVSYTNLKNVANPTFADTTGAVSTSQVTCVSCHRTHASGFSHMLRFDYGYEFMTVGGNYLGSDNPLMTSARAPLQHRGRMMADNLAAFYDRPASTWASYQRVLCNKCHAKD